MVRLAGEGASADAKKYGDPAVVRAAAEGHTEVVEALLRLGCDPNAPNPSDWTALMRAAAARLTALGHTGAYLWAVASNVLVGMQPRRMHRPPSSPSLIIAQRAPAAVAALAAEVPADPPPRTMTS